MVTGLVRGERPRLPRAAVVALAVGLLVRELLAPWTGHPYDLESFVRTGFAVAHGLSPYGATAPPVPGASFAYLTTPIALVSYPPVWPEFTGAAYLLWTALPGANRFVLYALLKQPAIAADLATAYLLWRLALRWGARERSARTLLVTWAFFPYAIAISAVWGQFDAIVVALVLASLMAASSRARALAYGLGALVKWITVVFVPLELARAGRREAVAVLGVWAGVAVVGLLPFLVQSWSIPGFASLAVYVGHGDNYGMNYVYLLTRGPWAGTLGSTPLLYASLGFLWVPVAIAAGIVGARFGPARRPEAAVRSALFVLTAVFLVRWGLYEQYFLYLFALVALDLTVFHGGRRALAAVLLVLASAQLLVNNDLGLRFLVPADPSLGPVLALAEANGPLALARAIALGALAVAMTVTLVQWLWVLFRDESAPRPWPLWLLARRPPLGAPPSHVPNSGGPADSDTPPVSETP
jgi:hypothetical protein